ncbi:hypothetical protein BDZ89DRAFT_938999 [Hymenopellis radicata]|nr:hypothetical protein BDZ89DRAFT_938999 [Hymenopellis radicata]
MLQPAHATKHLPILQYGPFTLAQSDNGLSNGTALWLGAQVLSAYLTALNLPVGRALELGSGIGLSSLTLAALGWSVVATDLPDVIDAVLAKNVAANDVHQRILVQHLDWTHSQVLTEDPVYDLIITADTIYSPSLIRPLLDTIHAFATRSPRAHLFVCLERRDPPLIDSFFAQAHQLGFRTDQIPSRKLSKALKKAGIEWSREDWEGIQLWKLRLS